LHTFRHPTSYRECRLSVCNSVRSSHGCCSRSQSRRLVDRSHIESIRFAWLLAGYGTA